MKKVLLTLLCEVSVGGLVVFLYYFTALMPLPEASIFEPYLASAGFAAVCTIIFGLIARYWGETAISIVLSVLVSFWLYVIANARNAAQLEIYDIVAGTGYNTPVLAFFTWGWVGQLILSVLLVVLCWGVAKKKSESSESGLSEAGPSESEASEAGSSEAEA